MIVASALKHLLYLLRYPALPSQANLVGEYRVGAVQTRIPGATACQIHYPTLDETATNPNVPYFRPAAAAGVADYSRQPASLMAFLSARTHPCLMGATPVPHRQFPLVIFSHGLGGCMEMYTALCQHIASQGYCVIALEHQDGSGAYAEDDANDGTPIFYKRPDDTPYSRHKVLNFRRPFLAQRVQEIAQVLDHVRSMVEPSSQHEASSWTAHDATLQRIWQAVDTNSIHLLGHSFGGATMVLAAHNKDTLPLHHNIASLAMLDCWAFSLDDETLQRGCGSLPTLSILSEAWLTNPETAQVQQLLQNTQHLSASMYCPNSVHASFSDAAHWLPGPIARSLRMRAPQETRHGTIRTVAQACVQHMQQQVGSNRNDDDEAFLFPGLEKYAFANESSMLREPTEVSAS